jgi:hypothetical protein
MVICETGIGVTCAVVRWLTLLIYYLASGDAKVKLVLIGSRVCEVQFLLFKIKFR